MTGPPRANQHGLQRSSLCCRHYEPCFGDPFAGEGSGCFGNRYAQLTSDIRAQWAMNLTYFHWGVHAWVAYCVVGLLLAAVVYRKCVLFVAYVSMQSLCHPWSVAAGHASVAACMRLAAAVGAFALYLASSAGLSGRAGHPSFGFLSTHCCMQMCCISSNEWCRQCFTQVCLRVSAV